MSSFCLYLLSFPNWLCKTWTKKQQQQPITYIHVHVESFSGFFKIYKQFYEKIVSIQLLVCSISIYNPSGILYSFFYTKVYTMVRQKIRRQCRSAIHTYKSIYDGQSKNTKARIKLVSWHQANLETSSLSHEIKLVSRHQANLVGLRYSHDVNLK